MLIVFGRNSNISIDNSIINEIINGTNDNNLVKALVSLHNSDHIMKKLL